MILERRITLNNKELLDKILLNKNDYFIWVYEDTIFAEDRIDKTTYNFSIYGKEMIVFLFRYFGFDAINVY